MPIELPIGGANATVAAMRLHVTTFFQNYGGSLCRVCLLIGFILFLIQVLPSDQFCCSSSRFFLNHQGKDRMPRAHQPSDLWTSSTNISHLVFGIAGSINTWRNRGHYVDLWWRPNQTRGFVWLDRAPTEYPWPSTSPPFRVSEDTARFRPYARHGMPFAIRMTRVILETFKLGMEDVRWFVFADDDTVLFVDNLVEVLAKYDHQGYYYIGGISECVIQNTWHSFVMAFGGAGFAVSYPLVKSLSKILDGCIQRYPNLYGSDHIIQSCMAELGVTLTRLPGIHQFDLHGDISGLLSAHPQAPLLSFHHLDFVDPIFPNMTRQESLQHLKKAERVDSSRLLQQTICYDHQKDWSYSISWGYSAQIYEKIHPSGFLQIPLETFRPWNKRGKPPYMFNVRPVLNDPCMAPRLFYLKSVRTTADHIVTDYIRKGPRLLLACGNYSADSISRIMVFSPVKRLLWVGARRECCEILLPLSTTNVTEIRIRPCWEDEAMN